MRILVAGGAGFIGSAYVRHRLAAHPDDFVRVFDKLTYAGRRENLEGLEADRVELVEGEAFGIHHLASAGQCSWYEFAQEIFDQAGVECRVMSATTAMLARKAPRPAYSVLGSERSDARALPSWKQGLAAYLAEREALEVGAR